MGRYGYFHLLLNLHFRPNQYQFKMIDNIITAIYLLVVLIIGIWAGRKVKTLNDFSVAGRSFPAWVIFATLSASFIGGGFSIGNAEKVFRYGLVNIFALWGFSFKELLVAWFIAPRMGRYKDPISVGDIMDYHYGKNARVITGVLSVVLCAGILGAQVGAIGYIFNVFLGIDRIYGIIIGCGIVIAYSTIGGMRAVIFTDIFQFVVLSIGIPAVLVFAVIKAGGVAPMLSAVPPDHLTLLGPMTITAFLSLFLTFVVGETLVPPYVQRLFLSRDVEATKRGTLLSGLFSFPFFFITGAIGLAALALFPDINPDLALLYTIKHVLPVVMQGIVVAGVISIVMSSADSFLNSAAVSAVQDIIKPLIRTPVDKELFLVKGINLLTGILAVVFAINIKSILDILIYSYHFWSPVMLVPLAAGIMGVRVKARNFYWGMTGGILAVFVWKFILGEPGGVSSLIVGVAANGLLFLLSLKISNSSPPSQSQAK
jgi:solute:Na+ symporter, SSS family